MKIGDITKLQLDSKKILLIAISAVFVIYIDCSFLIKAQVSGLRSLSAKATALKKNIESFNKDSAALKGLSVKQGGSASGPVKEVLTENKLAGLLEYISDAGNANNVKIMQLKTAREARAKNEKPAAAVSFAPVYITLEALSNYHNLGAFITALENAGSFLAVEDITIMRDKSDYLRQQVNLTLRTYVKK